MRWRSLIFALAIAAAAPSPAVGDGCDIPEGYQLLARKSDVRVTTYFVPNAEDYAGKPVPIPGIGWLKASPQFLKDVQLEGHGQVGDYLITLDWSSKWWTEDARYQVSRRVTGKWGAVSAWETAAAHPALAPPGAVVCIVQWGVTVTITDTGSGLRANGPLDVFVGTEAQSVLATMLPKESGIWVAVRK